MATSAQIETADIRVRTVLVTNDELSVGCSSVPVAWYPRLASATAVQRSRWEIAGGGYAMHWPEMTRISAQKGCSQCPCASKLCGGSEWRPDLRASCENQEKRTPRNGS